MERDLSLIREILLRIEEQPEHGKDLDLSIPGYADKTVVYNLDLAIKADLVEGRVRWAADTSDIYTINVRSLTWGGHDFLDSVRQEDVWKATQEKAATAGHNIAQLSLDIIKGIAISVIKGQLSLPS